MTRLDILWEDAHGLAVCKPPGLLTQPARVGDLEPTLGAQVRQYLCPASPGSVYLGTIHRLDRPVSGVVLWAKTPRAARRWAEQFAARRVQKTYWAIVEVPPFPSARRSEVWTDWLTGPDRSGRARVTVAGTAGAVEAETRVEWASNTWLGDDGRFAWLILHPATGRTHQLRAQTAARGWPIVGDQTYGARTEFDAGIALHAARLQVEHPIRRDPLVLEAKLSTAWDRWDAAQRG